MGNFFRYASEGIQAACQWAYKGAPEGSVLEGKLSQLWKYSVFFFFFHLSFLRSDCFIETILSADDYFLSRLPIVNLRLAQGGVRLAATLNRIFG